MFSKNRLKLIIGSDLPLESQTNSNTQSTVVSSKPGLGPKDVKESQSIDAMRLQQERARLNHDHAKVRELQAEVTELKQELSDALGEIHLHHLVMRMQASALTMQRTLLAKSAELIKDLEDKNDRLCALLGALLQDRSPSPESPSPDSPTSVFSAPISPTPVSPAGGGMFRSGGRPAPLVTEDLDEDFSPSHSPSPKG